MSNDTCERSPNPLDFDAIVERFEMAWESASPRPVDRFLAECTGAATDAAFRRQLLLTLVSVDLEHRWRMSTRKQANVSDGSLPEGLPPRPTLEDYARQIPEIGAVDQIPLEIVVDEFRARTYWGDQPSVDQYAARFRHLQEQLQRTLVGVFDEVSPTLLKVYCHKHVVYSTRFVHPIEIGRQCPCEPPPIRVVETDADQRLVIASLEERRLSRRHLHLKRVNSRVVRVTSLTTKGCIGVESTQLPPGAVMESDLPVLLVLGQHVIRVELLE